MLPYNRPMPFEPGFEPVLRAAELRAVEARAAGQPLMERAGLAAATVARTILAGRDPRVLVLAGPGNNGGDAFVVARWIRSWSIDVELVFHGDPARLPLDAAQAHRAWIEAGGTVASAWREDATLVRNGGRGLGLIVDGIFGLGLARPIEGAYAEWVTRANAHRAPTLSLDIPSGLDADTGVAREPTVRAAATATFIALKPGLLTLDGPDHCGAISTHPLELERELASVGSGYRVDWQSMRRSVPEALKRARGNVHKGSFGSLAVIGGADGMVGAALLAARAALHLGAGKVFVGLTANKPPVVDWLQPELMLRPAENALDTGPNATVIGPGLGQSDHARAVLVAALASPVPLVIDADGLTLIAVDSKLKAMTASRRSPTVLTPHPGEAARLAGTTVAAIQSDRVQAALSMAHELHAAVVLKGAGSVLAFPDGRWAINSSGNAGLATAGSGDVLAGVLGALLAQGVAMSDAIQFAVCLHGAAADQLAKEGVGPLGLTASELAPAARRLINTASTSDH